MPNDYSELPWNFEAFRKFIDYKTLQNAAAVIVLFENKEILKSPKELDAFENLLNKRTGLEWSPERKVSEDIQFNMEGTLFRNKARVLTSFYLIDPIKLRNNEIVPTQFCKALGAGYISEGQFYREIFSRFTYPHPAYDENWDAWTAKGITLKPLIFILDILEFLAEHGLEQAYLTVTEFAEFGHTNPFQDQTGKIASSIVSFRKSDQRIKRKRSDKIERKIGDIFGFMCMSEFCYYDKNSIRLNLLSRHPEENVQFYQKRGDVNMLESTKEFINQNLNKITNEK